VRKTLLTITAIISLSQITGCTAIASGKTFSEYSAQIVPEDNKAKVVIFRPGRFTGSGDTMLVVADGNKRGELRPVGFLAFDIPSRKIKLHTDTAAIDRQYELDAKPGSTYYFETKFKNYVVFGAWDLIPTPESEAKELFKDLRRSY
jgi:hypothetical protein